MTDDRANPAEQHLGEWLQGNGPDSEIAVCTRVRFARNVEGFRFSTNMTGDEATELNRFLASEIRKLSDADRTHHELKIVDLASLEELEREVLIERHLISRDQAQLDRDRSVAVDDAESISVMINEEDHLRTQVFQSGLQIDATFAIALSLDEEMIRALPLAFSEQFGFLTSCPTNLGTGLRLSVMLHLPGLVWAQEMEKAATTAEKIHLAVRGLYGEGSRALGDFYQVSNQVTLGRAENQILDDVKVAVNRLVEWERRVRDALLEGERRVATLDKIYRALGTLQNAHILSGDECLNCLSAVRLGAQQGMIPGLETRHLNQILLLSQPAHLQRLCRQALDASERAQRRAAWSARSSRTPVSAAATVADRPTAWMLRRLARPASRRTAAPEKRPDRTRFGRHTELDSQGFAGSPERLVGRIRGHCRRGPTRDRTAHAPLRACSETDTCLIVSPTGRRR